MKGHLYENCLVRLESESEEEKNILSEFFEHGIRVFGHSTNTISMCSPRFADAKGFFFLNDEIQVLLRALVTYKQSTTEKKLVDKLLLELIG